MKDYIQLAYKLEVLLAIQLDCFFTWVDIKHIHFHRVNVIIGNVRLLEPSKRNMTPRLMCG